MDFLRWIGVGAAAVAAIFLVLYWRDPHHTALPVGSADLAPVAAQLAKLPPNERELVEEYVQRSHGDVLPARFADPDNPLTARTFGDAIALQRRWREKQTALQAHAEAHMAERDRDLAPLRAIVNASVAKRELLSRRQLTARRSGEPDPGIGTDAYGAKRALPSDVPDIFAATIALENAGDSDVIELTGAVMAKDRDAPLSFDLCWINIDETDFVPVGGRREVLCANPDRPADAQHTAFVQEPSRFAVTWQPRHIKLRNGTVLNAKLP